MAASQESDLTNKSSNKKLQKLSAVMQDGGNSNKYHGTEGGQSPKTGRSLMSDDVSSNGGHS